MMGYRHEEHLVPELTNMYNKAMYWFTPHFLLINLRKNQTSFLYMVLN
ncbi:hypothetical protein PAECIP111893_02081 [Paenibacillus plantiphilus]|uniref:Uncharacterized protein n=1 Tax=Paenibacillus plantiphilus TaxID=2905650 RepID=A0ABM9C4I5_9BACL|nr:hypothetical protein PAECIP111893_02081 [Paenibacillus plantiphilus]